MLYYQKGQYQSITHKVMEVDPIFWIIEVTKRGEKTHCLYTKHNISVISWIRTRKITCHGFPLFMPSQKWENSLMGRWVLIALLCSYYTIHLLCIHGIQVVFLQQWHLIEHQSGKLLRCNRSFFSFKDSRL